MGKLRNNNETNVVGSSNSTGNTLGKRLLYVLGGLSFLGCVDLIKINHDLKESLVYAEAENNELKAKNNEWFLEYSQYSRNMEHVLSIISDEALVDADSLAKMKDRNIKQYQEHGNNIEKNLLGNIQDFMKVFRDSFDIKEEQWENGFGETFDIKITPGKEYYFAYNGYTYRYDIDPEKYEIRFKIRNESLQDCGYVRVNLGKIGDDSTSTVGATEVVVSGLFLGDGSESFKFNGNGKVIERSGDFYVEENAKSRIQNESYFCLKDEKTGRMRFFDNTTGQPLEGLYFVNFEEEPFRSTFNNGFPVGETVIFTSNGYMSGPCLNGKRVGEWFVFKNNNFGAELEESLFFTK